MKVFLVDGTYELFRHHFGRPGHITKDMVEVDAVRGVLGSVLQLFESGATHLGVATDHVIESFRNRLYPPYKSGDGVAAEITTQFPILEEALVAMGVTVWPMIELEADDGLASAAHIAKQDDRVEQVVICTADKDLAQCVEGARVVQVDRRKNVVFDAVGVQAKFGVPPESIADYLALVGDSADGFPGIAGFGAKTAAAVLTRYGHIENIPADGALWDVNVRGAHNLARTLVERAEEARLFKVLATVRIDDRLFESVDELRWQGPTEAFVEICSRLESNGLLERAQRVGRLRQAALEQS